MANLNPKVFSRLIQIKGWHPYIKSQSLYFGARPHSKLEVAIRESSFTSEMSNGQFNKLIGELNEKV